MSNTKISQMTAASTPLTGAELVPLVQAGSNVQVAFSDAVPILSSGGITTVTALGADLELDIKAGTSGAAVFSANDDTGSGPVNLHTGSGIAATGLCQVYSGNSTNNTGQINLITGNSSAANSGDIFVQTGTAGVTRGSITLDGLRVIIPNLPTSSAGLPSGALWNSTGTVKVVA